MVELYLHSPIRLHGEVAVRWFCVGVVSSREYTVEVAPIAFISLSHKLRCFCRRFGSVSLQGQLTATATFVAVMLIKESGI
jgi:hypothetical protein